MLLFVLRLLPLVKRLAGDRRRSGRKLENDPAVLCLELGKAPRSTMDQVGSGLPKRNLALFGVFFDQRQSLILDVQRRSHLMLFWQEVRINSLASRCGPAYSAQPLTGDVRVHRVRRKIDVSGPRDCTMVDEHLLEETRISQRRKNTSQ